MEHAQVLLHTKIFELLSADEDLRSLLRGSNRVFDFVPDNQPKPYVALGTPIFEPFGSHTFDGFEIVFPIHAFAESSGRRDAQKLASRIFTLLHNADLEIDGFETVVCEEALSQVEKEDDGKTHHALMQYRIILGGNHR